MSKLWRLACLFLATVVPVISLGCIHELPIGHHPPMLAVVCLRIVEGGYLYGRTATWASHRVPDFKGPLRYSHRGACVVGLQGPMQRVVVCLRRSSPCLHDRTTGVWPDQVDYYFDRYPGSHRGKCTSECAKHEDDCVARLNDFRGPEDWVGWMQHMDQLRRQRMRR